jgi:PAS domain S-box-containing protein
MLSRTERRRALDKLQESEIKYRTLFDNANDATLLIRNDVIMDWNQRAVTMFGFSKEEIIGQSPYALFPSFQPDGRDSAEKAREKGRSALAGKPQFFEWRHCRRDGALFETEVSLNRVEIREEPILMAIVRDVSERKESEKKLQVSEEKYRSIFENAVEGIFQTTPEGRYITVNPALARTFGFDSSQELMDSISDIGKEHYVNPEDRERLKRVYEEQGYVEGFEAQLFKRDGSKVWVLINARAVTDSEGRTLYYEGTLENITHRKEIEGELKVKSLSLEEVNAALKVLLKQRDRDKEELEEKILYNVKKLVLPYIERLKERRLDDEQKTYLAILETNLKNIVSPFVQKMVYVHASFTASEILVANFIKEGKTIKEIARISGVSENAINRHRQNIRNKLGLNKRKVNLKAYLMSMK